MDATPSLGIKKGERETVRFIWLGVGPDLKGDSFTQPGNFMGPSVGKSLDRAEGSPWKRNKLHKAAAGISWGLRPSGVKSKAPETPFKAPIHPRCSTSENGSWSPSRCTFCRHCIQDAIWKMEVFLALMKWPEGKENVGRQTPG